MNQFSTNMDYEPIQHKHGLWINSRPTTYPGKRLDKESSPSHIKEGSNNLQEQLVPDKPEYAST